MTHAKVSKATDVYGLGAVFYQLLTGHPPFAGGTTYETIKLLLETEPRQPRLLNPKIDRDLSTICLKCLEKDPKRRYSSALALAEDLEHWLKHEPIQREAKWVFHTWPQMGATKSKHRRACDVVDCPRSGLGVVVWNRESARLDSEERRGASI